MSPCAPLLAIVMVALTAPWPLLGQSGESDRARERAKAAAERGLDPGAKGALQARQRATWFPDTTSFAPLLAAPRETSLRGAFLLAERSHQEADDLTDIGEPRPFAQGDYRGRNLEADVALGHRIPVLLLRREGEGGPSLVLEFEVGTFSRFFMETAQRDFINIDYQVGVPLSAGWRDWEGRVQLRHMSSHSGDDFIRRFGISARTVSMEGIELLVARRLGDVRAYVGGEAYARSNRELERTAARVGIELDPRRSRRVGGARPAGARPYAAADFRVNSAVGRVEGAGVAGISFGVRGKGLRFEGRGHFGPSPMGWLRRSNETYFGIGMRVEL